MQFGYFEIQGCLKYWFDTVNYVQILNPILSGIWGSILEKWLTMYFSGTLREWSKTTLCNVILAFVVKSMSDFLM